MAPAIGRKFLGEPERPRIDTHLDSSQLLAGTTQVRFVRDQPVRGAIAHAVNYEVELDAVSTDWSHAARCGFPAHMQISASPSWSRLCRFSSTIVQWSDLSPFVLMPSLVSHQNDSSS